ncbi:hypothetical protein ACVIN2_003153 [Bradyrhizobium sp. USDA 3650]
MPTSQQPKAKRALQEIWMAKIKAAAELAFDAFIESYTPKYEKAADCLSKDRHTLLAFYDFPAEHRKHLRTTDEMDKRFFLPSRGLRKSLLVHSFVRSRCGPFFRPGDRSRSRRGQAVKAGRTCGHRTGLALTGQSTTARGRGTGLHSRRGSTLPSAAIMVLRRERPHGEA